MIQLPPTEFTFRKYDGGTIPWSIAQKSTEEFITWLLSQNIIGYCNSMDCEILPRIDEIAVMFEIDEYQTWSHISIEVWNEYLKRLGDER